MAESRGLGDVYKRQQRDAASGLRSSSDSGQMQARKDLVFSEITPLDTIESITIGDLTIPVPQS